MLSPQRYLIRLAYFMSRQDWRCTDFVDGNWKECCEIHDAQCADALAQKSKSIRHIANLALKDCVTKKGHPCIAQLMYEGVEMEMEREVLVGELDNDR